MKHLGTGTATAYDTWSSSTVNAYQVMQNAVVSSSNSIALPTGFGFQYNEIKRSASPGVHLYSTGSATIDSALATVYCDSPASSSNSIVVGSFFTAAGLGNRGIQYNINAYTTMATIVGTGNPSATLTFQATIDARLGIVA